MKTTCLLFIFSLFISLGVLGQNTEERENFMSDYFKAVGTSGSKEDKSFINNELYPLVMDVSKFPEKHFQQAKSTVKTMNEKGIAPLPHLYNYVTSVYSLIQAGKTGNHFDSWQSIVDDLLQNRNSRRIEDFLKTSEMFLFRNVIAEDPNYNWKIIGDDFEFINDRTPTLKFTNVTVICKTLNKANSEKEIPFLDSVIIKNTSGIVDLNQERWSGKGGVYSWEKAGLSPETTIAHLSNYTISFKSTNFSADSVSLTTPFINEPVLGRITDRAVKGNYREDRDISYPQFSSYQANYEIKNIVDGVDYSGGFSLVGPQFIGIGSENQQAKIIYYRNSKPFITTFSDQVQLSENSLKTEMANFVMRIGLNDSITHTGLDIEYTRNDQTLKMKRGGSAMSQAPFVNSFHKLNIYVDELTWSKNSTDLILSFNNNTSEIKKSARFESFDYYDEALYSRLQGMESVHPLVAIYNYAYKYDKFQMDEGTAATALNRTLQQAKPTLLELSALGFISYDTERGAVNVNQKTEHFIKSKANKIDYDNISFVSDLIPIRSDDQSDQELTKRIAKRNAERAKIKEYGRIDLSSLDMNIQAVDFITVAETKRTTIFPDSNKVTVTKDRDMVFSGWVNSGKWEVKIEKGNFDYTENKFNIFDSKVAYFNANPLRAEDGKRAIPLQSVIDGIQGELLVDDVNNRSGKRGFEQYPILISNEKTRVYYDQQQLHRGAYKKESFYFEVDPFQIDSLLTFNEKSLRFPGELTSAGIFPKMKDDLKIMSDYSLGFSQDVPKEGYQFYGTEGKYENKILLSNNGLQGGGTINFINSSSTSKTLFTFLPDSTIGVASFINRPQETGVEFPDAEGPDAFITFLPKNKVLKARSNKEEIKFFNGEASLKGETVLNQKGMKGQGTISLPTAKMRSTDFDFSRWTAEAEEATFTLTNTYKKEGDLTEDPLAFRTENVSGKLDFSDRLGVFKPNSGESIIEFPVNQYVCKIDQFTWQMDQGELQLEKDDKNNMSIESGMDLAGPNFFSTHPKQDSLQFLSPKARFSLKERTIYAYDAEFIEVADARIFPDSAAIVIRKNAKMDKFENAKIVANFITKYHTVTNVSAEITARRAYTAIGEYKYGKEGDEKQLINLTEIRVDSSYQTIAKGEISQGEGFKLSEEFDFYGKINMKAGNPFLTFNGATKVNHECKNFERSWMSFKTEIDPERIQIPVGENMVDLEGNKITAGIRWRNTIEVEEVKLYPTFLSQVKGEDDREVFSANGLLEYNPTSKEFRIASKDKLVNQNETGNYLSLNTSTCSLNGDGNIELGIDYGALEVKSIGVLNYNQETEQTDFNLTMAIRAPVDQKIFRAIGSKIIEVPGIKEAIISNTNLEKAIVEWVDLKTADKIKSDYTLKGEFKNVPKQMQDAIILTGVKLTTYTKDGENQRGLKSTGLDATLVNVFNQPVMKDIQVKIFAQQRYEIGGRLGILLNAIGGNEYFIDYDNRKDGVMSILSNDTEFNTEITELKADKKKSRKFIYDITQNSAYKSQFLRVFN